MEGKGSVVFLELSYAGKISTGAVVEASLVIIILGSLYHH